jgi:hypothetical protein
MANPLELSSTLGTIEMAARYSKNQVISRTRREPLF